MPPTVPQAAQSRTALRPQHRRPSCRHSQPYFEPDTSPATYFAHFEVRLPSVRRRLPTADLRQVSLAHFRQSRSGAASACCPSTPSQPASMRTTDRETTGRSGRSQVKTQARRDVPWLSGRRHAAAARARRHWPALHPPATSGPGRASEANCAAPRAQRRLDQRPQSEALAETADAHSVNSWRAYKSASMPKIHHAWPGLSRAPPTD